MKGILKKTHKECNLKMSRKREGHRNTNSHQKLENPRKEFLPRVSRGTLALPHPDIILLTLNAGE
jgi:hypothetical protein